MEEQATQRQQPAEAGEDSAPARRGVGPIRACVREALEDYFRQLDGYHGAGLYKMVLTEMEVPLLEVVMRECGGNQTRASEVLGINRGTLRKKLQHYGLDD
ncbi:DNA-binding transcriptional regulator Fis [Arhodomonas sp. AD133]|uniref:DNA-binding transcriptional regulator Fis n=1 Tax=Arhodomonas sp. AD133 TaxID=3415009 RepID=UPI003EBAB74E